MQERNSDILLRFLHSLREKKPQELHLFLLGDIFDLWVGGSNVFVNKFKPLVEALRELKSAGARITYIEGNHDVHIDSFWQKKLGIEVFVEAQFYKINGLEIRVEHGDLINLDDETYLKYRAFIRRSWVKPLSWLIPGKVWDEVGNYAARKSRKKSHVYRIRNEEKLHQMIRTHAERVYGEHPYDAIVSGHMHVHDDYRFQAQGKEARSFNLGSWYGDEVKVLKLSGQQFEWITIS